MIVTISCRYFIAFEVVLLFLVLIWRRLTDILEFFYKRLGYSPNGKLLIRTFSK